MDKENIKIDLSGHNGEKPITVLVGQALTPREKKQVKIAGNIDAVSRFLEHQELGKINKATSFIVINRDERTIILQIDADNQLGDEVKGSLNIDSNLKNFPINDNKTFNATSLAQILKTNVMFFDSLADKSGESLCVEIITKLKNLVVRTQGAFENASNDRGNTKSLIEKSVSDTNIPENFYLKMPLFKGQEAVAFKVDICFEVKDNGVVFWLDSTELRILLANKIDEIINSEIDKIKKHEICIIEQ